MQNSENKTQEQKTQDRINREIENFNAQLIPFGYADIKAAIETALEAGKDGDWTAEQITEFIDSTETKLEDIDPVYVVYDSLLQEARNDIEQLANKDIVNDTRNQVEVYANFMCTSLDYTEEAQKELKEIMAKIPKEDFTEAMNWLWNNAELDNVEIEEENSEEVS
jgi:hypothetical protein